jgi:hypothetical protein
MSIFTSVHVTIRVKILTLVAYIKMLARHVLTLIHNLYSSPSIIRKIMSRRRWAGHVARMEKRNAYRISRGNPEGKDHWEDQDVGG